MSLRAFLLYTSLCMAVAAATAIGAIAGGREATPPVNIELKGAELVLLEIFEEAPLEDVLLEVARRAHFALHAQGDLGRVQPQILRHLPFGDAVRRLVGGNRVNLLLRYKISHTGKSRLVEVRAREVRDIPAATLQERRIRAALNEVRVPPLPPPPVVRP